MKVVGIFDGEDKFKSKFTILKPNIILINRTMLDKEIGNFIHQYRDSNPQVKLIYLSSNVDDAFMYEWIKNNPDGVLFQDMSPAQFVHSLREVYQDQLILSGKVAKELVKGFQEIDTLEKFTLKARLSVEDIEVSKHELDIFYSLLLRKRNEEIMEALNMSKKEVREDLRRVYQVLQVKNRSGAERKLNRLMRG